MIELEKWDIDEDKFMDLVENLKKNDAIKDFVAQSLLEKDSRKDFKSNGRKITDYRCNEEKCVASE